MFIGRQVELAELHERYQTEKTEIISILGRRRVGKSQLIFKSSENFDGLIISFECSATSYFDNIESLTKLIRETFKNKYLTFSSLYDILMFLQDEAAKQKILFIIDEYPYLRKGSETDSEIKNAIDSFNLKEQTNPLKFIICGSAVDVMNILDDAKMPLHGRFDCIINLLPLNYLESSLFYPEVSDEEKIKYFSVFGGVPHFLKQINANYSFEENVIKLFFSQNGILRSELENQINTEINKIEKASFILTLINKKLVPYNDILQKFRSSFPNGEIDYPLNKLLKMKIVEKVFIKQDNGIKKPYYRIFDNAVSFYYSFLIRNFANRLLFSDSDYFERFIKNNLYNDFIPAMFERISFEFIGLMNQKKLLPFELVDLFTYIINDKKSKQSYQFDVVGKTKQGLINFECKFQSDDIGVNEVNEEVRQAELANENFIQTVFISKSNVQSLNKTYYLKDMFQKQLL